ncbi:MAG: hypothetical protein QOG97_2821 [Acidimicrobiaceae bacterium]|nr:hypothetical protein [Acidimicrobiaceae bacterium]
MGSLVAVTVWGQFSSGTATHLLVLDVAVGVVSCALLPVLLRWPVGGAVALTVLAALSPAATPPATMAALHVSQRRRFAVAARVAVAGITAHVLRGVWRPIGGLPFGWWCLLVVVSYAALVAWGSLTQARRVVIDSLRERAERAEADQAGRIVEARTLERTRIAREMHDVLAHRLSLLATYAGAIEFRPDASPEQLSRAAGVIRTNAHQALDELRDVIMVLRRDEGDERDERDGQPSGRPQPGLRDIPRLVDESRAAGMTVEFHDGLSDPDAVSTPVARTVYRVIQEGLTNARKHAAGEAVAVVLDGARGARLTIDITNRTPVTVPPGATSPGAGTGLIGLAERLQLAGGQLDHERTASGEFRLHAWLPWPP